MATSLIAGGMGMTEERQVTRVDPVCTLTLYEAYAWAEDAAVKTGFRWRVAHLRLIGWTARPTGVPLTEPPAPLVSLPSPRGGGVPPGA